jgi:hypothetical protein
MKCRYYFFICLGLTTIIACTKNDVPTTAGQRLYKLVFTNSMDSAFHVRLSYDGDEKLISLTDSNSQSHLGLTSLFYNGQDKLLKTTSRRYYISWNNLLSEGADSMILNAAGNIVKRLFLHNTISAPGNFITNSYGYDGQGRLIADTSHSQWNNSINYIHRYTYDANSNVVQTEYIYNPLNSPVITVENITYTTQLNPLYNLGTAGYLFLSSANILSKHLPLSMSSNAGNCNYSYLYNSNGTLAKIIAIYSGAFGNNSITTELFYQ